MHCNSGLHCRRALGLVQLEVALARAVPKDPPVVKARTKQRRGAMVVRRALEVTLEELGRVGFARLSLPRVAELAGIHKTSLYRRWPTKQELVSAALRLAVPAESELPDHGDLESDLVELARVLASFVASPAGMGVLRTLFADGEAHETRRIAHAMWGGSAHRAPRLVLERAVARGELRADADFDLLLYTIAGAVLHRTFVERKTADRRWARRLVRLLCEGAAPRPAARTRTSSHRQRRG
jgi:AcrR family transcriptional regulator